MRGDMASGAASGIALQGLERAENTLRQSCRAFLQTFVDVLQVAGEQANQRDQVVAVPVTVHIGFPGRDAAPQRDAPPDPVVMYPQAYREWSALAETMRAFGVLDDQHAALEGRQLAQ